MGEQNFGLLNLLMARLSPVTLRKTVDISSNLELYLIAVVCLFVFFFWGGGGGGEWHATLGKFGF